MKDDHDELDYSVAVAVASRVVAGVLAHGLPNTTFLNVNVPAVKPGDLKGIMPTAKGCVSIMTGSTNGVTHAVATTTGLVAIGRPACRKKAPMLVLWPQGMPR